MPAHPRPTFATARDSIIRAFAGLVLLALLLTVAPVRAGSPSPPPGSAQPNDVSVTLDRLSKGRVTTLGQIADQAEWRNSTAKRLSKAIAAIEADTQATGTVSPQTAEKITEAD